MKKKIELININCPSCGTPIVTTYRGRDVKGELLHKCSKCKRYWKVDYTNQKVIWVKGKEDNTQDKEFKLDMSTGKCHPLYLGNIDKALLRREGA
ncbi:hypothetical protein [Alkaliphilus peptidifermentans]|uniref:Uncharacterized protein n=1 Tax=Alkaliphilus peptidifermentans DSM 18978 TaxID=1120976 RepID=A0A1G5EIR3_9FIRM|nr:hypothetical protein [Alkaliphilus peptidifermentans]SCY26570.1 hypothetical protein SAMN03080606_01165 [Alkaliphilus peptidifermentans DSM 18978]